MKKWNSRRGETLTETLAALLLVALATALLVTMVTASFRLNAAARGNDARFYEELSAAEAGVGGESENAGVVAIKAGGESWKVPVSVTGGGGTLTSYERKEGAP